MHCGKKSAFCVIPCWTVRSKREVKSMVKYELKPCPFCGGDVRFDKACSYFRDSVIYCGGCGMVFTLDDCAASDDDIVRAWNRRAENG